MRQLEDEGSVRVQAHTVIPGENRAPARGSRGWDPDGSTTRVREVSRAPTTYSLRSRPFDYLGPLPLAALRAARPGMTGGGTPPPIFANQMRRDLLSRKMWTPRRGTPLSFRRFECTFCKLFIVNRVLGASRRMLKLAWPFAPPRLRVRPMEDPPPLISARVTSTLEMWWSS